MYTPSMGALTCNTKYRNKKNVSRAVAININIVQIFIRLTHSDNTWIKRNQHTKSADRNSPKNLTTKSKSRLLPSCHSPGGRICIYPKSSTDITISTRTAHTLMGYDFWTGLLEPCLSVYALLFVIEYTSVAIQVLYTDICKDVNPSISEGRLYSHNGTISE